MIMNADYGDDFSSDIRWSICEEAVQIAVYRNGVLAKAYVMKIESVPTDCKAWINLLERL